MQDTQDLADRIAKGDRRALARAVTLIESTRTDHRKQAVELLEQLRRLSPREALRIGLSGTPGVGKSTLIESFGLMLTGQGLKLAVLAVDPSSARSGGSILGDKTRMEQLSRDANAYIRPSPSSSTLGGVARRTREAIALCEAAGFDVVIVETVGVGQSETMVAEMTDIFLLLLAPAGGDELQGVKRGIMEIADMIVVNKADGELRSTAMRTRADYSGALRLLRKRKQDPEDFPKALAVSAVDEHGLDETWAEIQKLAEWRKAEGHWDRARAAQAENWFVAEVRAGLLARLEREPELKQHMAELGADVAARRRSPEAAAAEMLSLMGAEMR